jgi:nicotinate-nucleotide adenylyltransferase
MHIGIYGGSFNPIHFGHVGLAEWVIAHTDLDELWLMVTPNNPLKPAGMLAPEEERLRAAQEAVRAIPGVRVSDFEFHLPRPSYTANTLRALEQAYPEHRFSLVIGEDNLALADRWREWDWIVAHHTVYVYPRHQSTNKPINSSTNQPINSSTNQPINQSTDKPINQSTDKPINQSTDKHIIYLHSAPYFDISSTEIRTEQNEKKS